MIYVPMEVVKPAPSVFVILPPPSREQGRKCYHFQVERHRTRRRGAACAQGRPGRAGRGPSRAAATAASSLQHYAKNKLVVTIKSLVDFVRSIKLVS